MALALGLAFSLSGSATYAARLGVAARCESQFNSTAVEVVNRVSMRPSLVKGMVNPSRGFRESLTQIASAVKSLRPSRAVTETVLYPFSGFDLSTPLALFPDAKTYILIDRNSVIEERLIDEVRQKKLEVIGGDFNKSWVFWRETGHNVFPNLLKSIFSISPDSKITKIEFIISSDQRVSLELKFVDGRNGVEKTVHYWASKITDLPDEIKRDFLEEPTVRNWWEEKLLELAPRTVLLKGSHSLFRLTSYVDSPVRRMLLSSLVTQGGLVVEGASKLGLAEDFDWTKKRNSGLKPDRTRWELTDGDPQFASPLREETIDGVDFSYAQTVRVSIHGPNKSRNN